MLERLQRNAPIIPRIPLEQSQERIPIQTSAPSTPTDASVRLIGPYVVERELARGGMGSVLLAEDGALRRKVAIKLMAKELLDDQDALVRFQREARATASIVHPNVAMIYLVGLAEDGSPFIAMEHVDGGTLERVIRDRVRLPYSQVALYMAQACEALRAAKRQGIIHRDIKPGNIMLTLAGEVKLVDFGLAKFFNEDSYRTVAGMVMGTPRYMSPEQTQGREVDFRSDIYSLGATFYHVLTGRPPFDGDSPPQIMMKHVSSPLPALRIVNPEVPMEFDEVIRRCMAKDPNDRYQHYEDLISDLARIRLQYTAKERGSIISSVHDMPTVRMGPDGQPLAPNSQTMDTLAPGRVSSPSHSATEIALSVSSEHGTMWKWLLGGVVVFVILIGVITALVQPEETAVEEDETPAGGRSGLVTLMDRIMAEQNSGGAGGSGTPPARDFLAYRATQRIVEELGRAQFEFKVENRREASTLGELAASGAAQRIFDTDAGGSPLDGWRRPIEYVANEQLVVSAGLDGAMNTADDIAADADGTLRVEDPAPYERIDEAEERRRSRAGAR